MNKLGFNVANMPNSAWVGSTLNGKADWIGITLAVELPYWLMVPNCELEIYVREHRYNVALMDDFVELHLNPADDSRANCIYFGPNDVPGDVVEGLQESRRIAVCRKCKTVLLIDTRCNADAIAAHCEQGKRRNVARWYFRSLCDAHIELINKLVQHYRLATYDLFVYELSPWDIPTWFVLLENADFIRVPLLDYAEPDCKPVVMQFKDRGNLQAERETVKHIEPTGLQEALCQEPSTGEYELLDAINLMIRGDYSSAVRRIATAIEAMLESALRAELLKLHPLAEVEQRLWASRNDFPGRLRQYENLSGHEIPSELKTELDRTRNLRHEIVHRGRRLLFHERGTAQRAVDTGRWIFNRLENKPDRIRIREKKVAFRSLGMHVHVMDSSLTSDGVIVSGMGWPQEPSHDEIAVAAYFLWDSNGRQEGKRLDYWLAAEKELRAARWQSQPSAIPGASTGV